MMKITLSNSVPMDVVVDSASGDKRFEKEVDKIYDNVDVVSTPEELAQWANKNKNTIYIVGTGSSKLLYSYDEDSDEFVPLTPKPMSESQIDSLVDEFFPIGD